MNIYHKKIKYCAALAAKGGAALAATWAEELNESPKKVAQYASRDLKPQLVIPTYRDPSSRIITWELTGAGRLLVKHKRLRRAHP